MLILNVNRALVLVQPFARSSMFICLRTDLSIERSIKFVVHGYRSYLIDLITSALAFQCNMLLVLFDRFSSNNVIMMPMNANEGPTKGWRWNHSDSINFLL